jgi:hypothetical protein
VLVLDGTRQASQKNQQKADEKHFATNWVIFE